MALRLGISPTSASVEIVMPRELPDSLALPYCSLSPSLQQGGRKQTSAPVSIQNELNELTYHDIWHTSIYQDSTPGPSWVNNWLSRLLWVAMEQTKNLQRRKRKRGRLWRLSSLHPSPTVSGLSRDCPSCPPSFNSPPTCRHCWHQLQLIRACYANLSSPILSNFYYKIELLPSWTPVHTRSAWWSCIRAIYVLCRLIKTAAYKESWNQELTCGQENTSLHSLHMVILKDWEQARLVILVRLLDHGHGSLRSISGISVELVSDVKWDYIITSSTRKKRHCEVCSTVLIPVTQVKRVTSEIKGMLMLRAFTSARGPNAIKLDGCPGGNSSYCHLLPLPFFQYHPVPKGPHGIPWCRNRPTASCSTSFAVSGPSCGGSSPLPWADGQPTKNATERYWKHVLCRKG